MRGDGEQHYYTGRPSVVSDAEYAAVVAAWRTYTVDVAAEHL